MAEWKTARGHIAAALCAVIWGTTFISTKILLREFTPVEILFFRFLIGFTALFAASPRRLKLQKKAHEWYFVFTGLSGVTLYFLFENIALTYSLASNVSVIVTVAPFFTALLAFFFLKGEKPKTPFFVGFAVALSGIFIISFNGSAVLKLNPAGDFLALFAAIVWAVYSVIVKKISALGYGLVQTTRKVFFYGLILMIPALFVFGFRLGARRFLDPLMAFNLLYLGLGASALCFAAWNFAVGILGAVKSSVYIYAVPVVAVISSAAVLREPITALSALGTALTLAGLLISENKFNGRERIKKPGG